MNMTSGIGNSTKLRKKLRMSSMLGRRKHLKSMAEIFEKVLVEVMKAVGKGAAKIIVWTAHQIEKK